MKFLQGMMVAVLVFCGTAWAQDLQQIDIGTKGASLSAATDWKRVKLNADLGPDQFVSKRQLFLAVLEQEQVLSDPDEFDKALAVFAESIKVQDPTLVATSRRFASTQGMGHASTTFSCKLKGISLYYEIHMAGRDGLHYLFIGWSSVNEKLALAAEMRRIVASLKMPGAGHQMGKGSGSQPGRAENEWLCLQVQGAEIFVQRDRESAGGKPHLPGGQQERGHGVLSLPCPGL